VGFFREKNVLVTGAAGLAGSAAVIRLLREGSNVRATVFNSRKLNVEHENLEVIRCNLHDYQSCLDVTNNIDIVLNFAAYIRGAKGQVDSPTALVRNNVNPVVNMIDAAVVSGVDRFGFVGSSTSYPPSDTPILESQGFDGEPHSCYEGVGWMKRYSEKVCQYFHKNSDTKFAMIRTTAIYGPRDNFNERGHVIPQLIIKADRRDDPFEVWGDGSQIRDFIYVDDLVDGLLYVVENYAVSDPVNIATGTPVDVKTLAKTIVDSYEYNPEFYFDETKPTMIPKRLVDVTKASELGWNARSDLKTGVMKTVEWFRDNQ
jgi:GDP-L-fucose synthase|tara:strand:- start:768 stop:1715 length:948 start_codon:yes stop_codon:yes gene_type:complete